MRPELTEAIRMLPYFGPRCGLSIEGVLSCLALFVGTVQDA